MSAFACPVARTDTVTNLSNVFAMKDGKDYVAINLNAENANTAFVQPLEFVLVILDTLATSANFAKHLPIARMVIATKLLSNANVIQVGLDITVINQFVMKVAIQIGELACDLMNAGANQDGKVSIAQNVYHIGIAFTELVKILGNVFVKTGSKVKTVMLLKTLTEIGVNGVLGVIVLVKENKLEKGDATIQNQKEMEHIANTISAKRKATFVNVTKFR